MNASTPSSYRVTTQTVATGPTAIGTDGTHTLVADRPSEAGGGGLGFSGGQLLNLAIAACISNDMYREGAGRGINVRSVKVTVDSNYVGSPAVSTEILYEVEVQADADPDQIAELINHVDSIAEIPNSLRYGTPVSLSQED